MVLAHPLDRLESAREGHAALLPTFPVEALDDAEQIPCRWLGPARNWIESSLQRGAVGEIFERVVRGVLGLRRTPALRATSRVTPIAYASVVCEYWPLLA